MTRSTEKDHWVRDNERSSGRERSRWTIGLVMSSVTDVRDLDLWSGVRDVARERDLDLVCFPVGWGGAGSSSLHDLVGPEGLDGLLLGLYTDYPAFRSLYASYSRLPVVNALRLYEGYPGVVADNYQGMRSVLQHLVEEHGCRRLGFVRGPGGNVAADERYRALVDILVEHGLPLDPTLVAQGDFTTASGREAVRLLLDEREANVDAIVASNDDMAQGVLEALCQRGMRVPYDVAVTGFDDVPQSEFSVPPLTTAVQSMYDMGRRAAEALAALLEGNEVSEKMTVPSRLVVRRSCGCLSEAIAQTGATLDVWALQRRVVPFETAWASRREDVLLEMVRALGEDESGLVLGWKESLLDAFTAELRGERHGSFLETLDNTLREAAREGHNVNRWHSVLSALRRHALSCLTQSDLVIYRAQALWSQACVLVGERALQAQAREHALQMQHLQTRQEIGRILATEPELAGLLDAVADHLPRLGIRRCSLALYDNSEPAAEWARMVLAYDGEHRADLDVAGLRFPARQLVPHDLWPDWERRDLVVKALESNGEQFGFIVFDGDSSDRTAYEALASDLTIALRSALALQERVRTEAYVERSTLQLETVAEVGRAATSILDPDVLMQRIVDLVRERLDLYYAGLFLVDEDGEWTGEPGRWAVLRAGTGPAGQQMVANGHRLEIGGASMVGGCVARGEGRIALDVGQEAVRFDNPLLPDTRSELALPLVSRGRPVGAMTIQSAQSAAFTEADISALQVMADQLGNAVQNARLLEQAQARAEELAVLNEVGRALTAPLNAQEVSTVVYEGASRLLDARNFYLALYDEDRNEVTFPFDSSERAEDRFRSLPADQGLTGYIIRSRAPLLIDANLPERLVELGVDLKGAPALSWLGVPLLVSERVLGVMGVQSYDSPYAYNRHHQDLMVALGNQAAIALQSAHLWQETQRSLVEMEALNAITRAVSGILELDDVLRVALSQVLDLTDFDVGLISLVSPETGRLYLAVQRGLPDTLGQGLAETGMEGTLCDMVYQQGEALTVEDFAQGAPVEAGGLMRLGLRSYLGVPLESRGTALGTLCIFGYNPLSVQPAVLSLMRAVGQQVGVAVENARLYARAQRRAERESVLREIADRMQRATDLESLMRVAAEELGRALGASRAYVRLGTEGEWADGDGQDPRSALSEQPDGERE